MQTTTLALVALLSPSIALSAQTKAAAPQTGREVIERHIDAIGGVAAVTGVKSRYMVMTVTMSRSMTLGGESRVESWIAAPNKMYIKTSMPGIGVTEAGYDGSVAWTMSDLTGPTILPDSQAAQFRDQRDLVAALQRDATLTLRGQQQVEGRTVYVVDATMRDQRMIEYFDAESGLLVGMDTEGKVLPGGRFTMSFRDYRRFGNLLVATTMVVRLPTGDSLITRVERVDHGPIPDSVFALPKAVRELKDRSPPMSDFANFAKGFDPLSLGQAPSS